MARGDLRTALTLWHLDELAESAVLVLCELLTNAIQHTHESAEPEIETRFVRTDGCLRIEVHDTSDAWPVRRGATVDALNGRGLLLIDALADAWDVIPREGRGKIVWAQFDTSGEGGLSGV